MVFREKGMLSASIPARGLPQGKDQKGAKGKGKEDALPGTPCGCLACPKLSLHVIHFKPKDILTEHCQCRQEYLLKDLMIYLRSYPCRKHLCFTILQNTL